MEKIGPASFETWFKTTELQITNDGSANILVPNQFFADFIEEHFLALIEETLREADIKFSTIYFKPVEKDWKIVQPLSEEIEEAQSRKIPQRAQSPEQFTRTIPLISLLWEIRMAHAASLAVAEALEKPLSIL